MRLQRKVRSAYLEKDFNFKSLFQTSYTVFFIWLKIRSLKLGQIAQQKIFNTSNFRIKENCSMKITF